MQCFQGLQDFSVHVSTDKFYILSYLLQVKMGENVRIRLANLGHDAYPIHIHGHQFVVSASDGNIIPTPNWLIRSTVNVASGETYDVEFTAANPGNSRGVRVDRRQA